MNSSNPISLRQYQHHPRDWRSNVYVYPVISRRSGGLSIGVNLNPDMACNFDCVYCQVDRTVAPRVREVELARLRDELEVMIGTAREGRLFDDPAFHDVPGDHRAIRDIAFSGDGEPTTCKVFRQSVELAAELRAKFGLHEAKIVLITDACYLNRPEVMAALAVMDRNNGEIWAKLDAGTEEYYRLINRPNFPLRHVVENLIAAARVRPVVIQSLFLRLDGQGPAESELDAYVELLREVLRAGGHIRCVQVYTVARRPAQANVAALSNAQVDHIRDRVQSQTGLHAESFYGTPS